MVPQLSLRPYGEKLSARGEDCCSSRARIIHSRVRRWLWLNSVCIAGDHSRRMMLAFAMNAVNLKPGQLLPARNSRPQSKSRYRPGPTGVMNYLLSPRRPGPLNGAPHPRSQMLRRVCQNDRGVRYLTIYRKGKASGGAQRAFHKHLGQWQRYHENKRSYPPPLAQYGRKYYPVRMRRESVGPTVSTHLPPRPREFPALRQKDHRWSYQAGRKN